MPVNLRYCVLAVRAFNAEHVMIESELVEGQQQLESAIERLFSNPLAAYLHLHFATTDRYAARVERYHYRPSRDFPDSARFSAAAHARV